MDKQMFVRILNSEMELATGCTEPGAVALTAAEAGAALRKAGGTRVEAVTVRASINIIKNAMSAGIPGTDGIVEHNVEYTLDNFATLSTHGTSDSVILDLMLNKHLPETE